jgi:hypothetical protein
LPQTPLNRSLATSLLASLSRRQRLIRTTPSHIAPRGRNHALHNRMVASVSILMGRGRARRTLLTLQNKVNYTRRLIN